MIYSPGWATRCEILATALILNCNINVYMLTNKSGKAIKITHTTNHPQNSKTIDLLLSNNHFQALHLLGNSENTSTVTELNGSLVTNEDKFTTKKQKQGKNTNYRKHKRVNDRNISHEQKKACRVGKKTQQDTTGRKTEGIKSHTNQTLQKQTDLNSTGVQLEQSNENACTSNVQANKYIMKDQKTESKCRKLGVAFEQKRHDEHEKKFLLREARNVRKIRYRLNKLNITLESIPEAPPLTDDAQYDKAMDCIRSFELKEMTRKINFCSVCNERRIDLKLDAKGVCRRCTSDKQGIKMFSSENNMNPGPVPDELKNLSMIEQQLISRISPCINVHLLKHGGLASSGHCVTFPQSIDEAATILPRLPEEINIIRVQKKGKNDSTKEFRKIVKRLRRRQYDPVIIERTIGLVLGPSTALYEPFLKHCTLTNKAVGTL